MQFPHITLKEYALKLAKEGKLDELKRLIMLYPMDKDLRELMQVQLELKDSNDQQRD